MVYKCWLRTNLTKDLIVNDKGMVNELLSTSRAATNASEVAKVDDGSFVFACDSISGFIEAFAFENQQPMLWKNL